MPSLEKKRDLADFFKPHARARLFPGAGNVVPQKRPSPSPDTENIPPVKAIEEQPKKTPTKARIKKDVRTPSALSVSPISLPRSGTLPIRSPHPKSTPKLASVYRDARLFESKPGSASPSPVKPKTPSPAKRQTTLSFTNASQAPASTQAVVKEGKLVAVRDSDEDDSDSLASLDEIFGKKQDDDTTSASSPPELDEAKLEAERRRALSAFTRGRSEPLVGKDKLRALYARERAHKFDISGLLNDHFDDAEEEESIQKSRKEYNHSMKTLEVDRQDELDPEMLTSLIQTAGGDEDDLARLMSAVSRTEALSSEKSYLFFGPSGIRDLEAEPLSEIDFPDGTVLSSLFRSYDDAGRSRAYLSGHLSELAAVGQLPDEVLKWTFDSVLTERDDYLRLSYIECLRNGSSSWARTNVNVRDVQALFETLGASASSLQEAITPRYHLLRKRRPLRSKYLLVALDLFQAICEHMDFIALSSLVSIICRLALDEEVMGSGPISSKVEEVLQTLLSLPDKDTREHVTRCILDDMGQHLHDPNLQAQLLTHLMPASITACDLRIKLAVAFLLGPDSTGVPVNTSPTTLLAQLTTHVDTSPNFDTSHRNSSSLNYIHLRARAHVLDIAISDGHRPASLASRTEEAVFNKSVDALADAVHGTYVAILDSGASHMTRTEAKDTLTALYWRLLFAVRTRPRPTRHIFDTETGRMREGKEVRGEERGRDFMKGFLAKVRERPKTEEGRSEDAAPCLGNPSQDQSEPQSSYASAREEIETPRH